MGHPGRGVGPIKTWLSPSLLKQQSHDPTVSVLERGFSAIYMYEAGASELFVKVGMVARQLRRHELVVRSKPSSLGCCVRMPPSNRHWASDEVEHCKRVATVAKCAAGNSIGHRPIGDAPREYNLEMYQARPYHRR